MKSYQVRLRFPVEVVVELKTESQKRNKAIGAVAIQEFWRCIAEYMALAEPMAGVETKVVEIIETTAPTAETA